MSEAPTIPTPKGSGILKRKVFGIPVLYIAIVIVGALAIYAWRARSIPSEEPTTESDGTIDDVTYNDDENADPSLYPISPTGTVYAQSPQAVEDNVEYFGNDDWLRQAVAFLIEQGENPGEAQNALQAYLEGEDMTYNQGVLRDKAIKKFGVPPENFRAGVSAAKPVKPVATPKPTPAPVKPVTKPKPVEKPKPKPAPKPKRTHKVVRGDTLWDLAQKYYKNPQKWTTIASANKISNPRTLQIGKVLVIP